MRSFATEFFWYFHSLEHSNFGCQHFLNLSRSWLWGFLIPANIYKYIHKTWQICLANIWGYRSFPNPGPVGYRLVGGDWGLPTTANIYKYILQIWQICLELGNYMRVFPQPWLSHICWWWWVAIGDCRCVHKHQLGTWSGADCTISIMSTNGKPSIDMINSEKKQQNGDEKTVCKQRGGGAWGRRRPICFLRSAGFSYRAIRSPTWNCLWRLTSVDIWFCL